MKNLLLELAAEVSDKKKPLLYLHPKFEREYDEATRYSEFENMTKDEWVRYGKSGYETTIPEWKLHQIDNTEGTSIRNAKAKFDSLDPDKRKRFDAALEMGIIELPISLKRKMEDTNWSQVIQDLLGCLRTGINLNQTSG